MSVRILTGDVRAVLPTLPDESIHCVVTSPPYWGLRSYLPDGHADKRLEIGSDPTLQEWVDTMVEVFREVRRVLRPDGTLWLNLGDAYAGARGAGGMVASARRDDEPVPRSDRAVGGLKPKDMMGQPWRVAFALQADGWWLRQEIIWDKNNPMPESVRDRCTKSHEHLFLLTKSERYYFDADAIAEQVSASTHARLSQDVQHQVGSNRAHAGGKTNGNMKAVGRGTTPKAALATSGNDGAYADSKSERMGRGAGWRTKNNESFDAAMAIMPAMRNKRSVWRIPTEGFSGAHFATFPTKLVEPCILAGTSAHGVCVHCGAPWLRISESAHSASHDSESETKFGAGSTAGRLAKLRQSAREHGEEYSSARVTKGWAPGCACEQIAPVPATVLDIFGGSGTTGMVADRHHRNAILIDLDERNLPMAAERIVAESTLFAIVEAA